MLNKIIYSISISFYFFCVIVISAMCPDIFADEAIQVSVDGQRFDTKNFFDLKELGFRKDKVSFNKGWLGIFMENTEGKGILVKEITRGSPAAEAGLKVGDLITKIYDTSTLGKDEVNLIQFKKTIEAIGAGSVPVLTVSRDNVEMVFKPRLFGKLLKNVTEPIAPFISKEGHELTKEDKSTPPSQGREAGVENPFSDKEVKKPSHAKETGTSFIEFAIKNERYKDMLGATLQRIGEEAYAREGFQSNEETNPFRLSVINYFMLHPFDTPKIGQVIIDTFCNKDVCTQIGCAAELLDIKLDLLNVRNGATSSSPPFAGDTVKNFNLTSPLSPPCEEWDGGVVSKSTNVSPDIEQTQKMEAAGSLQGQLQRIIDSLSPAVSLIQEAFRSLSQEELEFLRQNAHKVWLPDEKIEPQDLARILALSQKVDLAKLFDAALLLMSKLFPFYYEQGINDRKKTHPDAIQTNLLPFHLSESLCGTTPPENVITKGTDTKGFAGDILFVQNTNIGKIVVGGTGTSYYYADAAVIIDLGGNDYYFNNAGSSHKDIPVSLCIDLSGDDVYSVAGSLSQGTGWFGIGLLIDCRGNDKYLCKNFSQGTGLFGVGLLMDRGGNDFYSGHVVNQGVGFFGAGLLNDTCGNDVYFSRQFAQGVGFTKGFGVLIDSDGNDFYFAGGEYPDFRDPGKSFQSMSQGMGMGIRPEESVVGASGGIGILIDQKGIDQYYGDYFSQGSGYYYSLGLLCDNEGNDKYWAGRYAQGAGIHSAIGLLRDTSGDDTYESTFGVSQGCGHDTGIGFLVDDCGDDVYRSKTTSQGVGLEKGIGVLADFYGNDSYHANDLSQGISSPSKTEEISGMGMLIDNQGDHDIFHDTILENRLLYRTNGGLVLNK